MWGFPNLISCGQAFMVDPRYFIEIKVFFLLVMLIFKVNVRNFIEILCPNSGHLPKK